MFSFTLSFFSKHIVEVVSSLVSFFEICRLSQSGVGYALIRRCHNCPCFNVRSRIYYFDLVNQWFLTFSLPRLLSVIVLCFKHP